MRCASRSLRSGAAAAAAATSASTAASTAAAAVAIVRGTGMGVHFGHLVAIHERCGWYEHVCVRDGTGHGHVAAPEAARDAADHAALQRHH